MRCRHCGKELTIELVDLGCCPLSNAFIEDKTELESYYELQVLVCDECWLCQTNIDKFKLDHDQIFTKNYPYYSSTSKSWVEHARRHVDNMSTMLELDKNS